jgi:membrane-associated phospholipid phosphatase
MATHGGALSHPGTPRRPAPAPHVWLTRVLWAYVVLGVGVLAVLSVAAHTIPYFAFDPGIAEAVQAAVPAPLGHVLDGVSWLGFPPEVDVVDGVIIVAALLVGYRWEGVCLLFAGVVGASSWFAVAWPVDRPRPAPDLVHVERLLGIGSYPSGHVLNLTAFFGSVFFLAWVALPPRRWYRVVVLVISGLVVLLIGVARVYSGEHWPSDVLAGYLQGSVVVVLTVLVYRWGQARWGRQGGQPPGQRAAGGRPLVRIMGH